MEHTQPQDAPRTMRGIRHFIWDFDGTLFDTYPIIIQNLQAALAAYGHSAPTAEIMRYMLDTIPAARDHYADCFGIPRAALADAYAVHHRQATAALEAPPMPGVAQVLRTICAGGRHNYIFTHRRVSETSAYLEKNDLDGCFREIVAPENGFAGKPAPDAVLYLMQKYHMAPAETVMVGDREIDLGSGRNAGVRTAHLVCALAPEQLACDWRLHNFAEMLALL